MTIEKTERVGIPHLHAPGNVMQMKADAFLEIINWLDSQGGKLSHNNFALSEKADGFGIRFGLDKDNKFFIESSRSGPVYDVGAFSQFSMNKKGSIDNIAKGYDDILKQLKDNKELNLILKKYNENGIKVISESYYLPNGVQHPTDNDLVKFIATYYKRSLIGNWATFVLLDVLDGDGKPLKNSRQIISEIKKLSNIHLIFDDSELKANSHIDFSKEISNIKKTVEAIEKEQQKKITDIVNNPSRLKSDQQLKKDIKAQIEIFQKQLSDKLKTLISSGKWGTNLEGLVFKLSNNVLFKVVTDSFKESKKQFNSEFKKPIKESFSFKVYLNNILKG